MTDAEDRLDYNIFELYEESGVLGYHDLPSQNGLKRGMCVVRGRSDSAIKYLRLSGFLGDNPTLLEILKAGIKAGWTRTPHGIAEYKSALGRKKDDTENANDPHVLLNADKGYKTYPQIAKMYRFDHRTKDKLRKRLNGLNRNTSAARKTSAGKKKYHKDGDKRRGNEKTEPLYEYNVESNLVKAAIRYYFPSDTATQK